MFKEGEMSNKHQRNIKCPICEKKYSVEFHNADLPRYPHLLDSYIHSEIRCKFCNQKMVILYNKQSKALKAVNEAWLLELKAHNSFSRMMKDIINNMEEEILINRTYKTRLELKKLKEVRDRLLKKHMRIQDRYRTQKMEWQTNLLLNEGGSIYWQSESEN